MGHLILMSGFCCRCDQFVIAVDNELVDNVDAQTLIKLVKFLKRGKAPGPDTIHNEVLRLGTTT